MWEGVGGCGRVSGGVWALSEFTSLSCRAVFPPLVRLLFRFYFAVLPVETMSDCLAQTTCGTTEC